MTIINLIKQEKKRTTCEFDCIELPLRRFFYRYAAFVGRNPWPFIIVPVIFTAICSFGFFFRTTESDAILLYTPTNARSKHERQVVTSLFPTKNGLFQPEKTVTDQYRCIIIVMASDGENILRPHFAKAVEELNQFIINEIRIDDPNGTSAEWGFQDLCMLTTNLKCWTNPIVPFVNTLAQRFPANLTYPNIFFGQRYFYIAATLGDVTLRPGTNRVESAKAWQLVYQLRFENEQMRQLSLRWQAKFLDVMKGYESDWLRIAFAHSETLNEELSKNVDALIPKFAITFFVLVTFAIISTTSFLNKRPYVDWVVSKPVLALCGICTAGMGVLAGIGFLCFCGFIFADIVCVVPFLIVSICAEYMFLMNGAWRRTNRCNTVEERLAESISIHAVSIVIAMFTGALSFAVGAITSIMAVHIFCIFCCVSMMLALVFQFTFFVGILALFGRLEEKGKNGLVVCLKTVPDWSIDNATMVQKVFNMGTVPDFVNKESPKNYTTSFMDRFFEDIYAPALMKPTIKCAVLILMGLYLGGGIWGCLELREGLKPANLVVQGSYAVDYYDVAEKHLLPHGQQVQVVIGNASAIDLSRKDGRDAIFQIVSAFANTPYTMGTSSVQFFLTEYMLYLRQFKMDRFVEQQPAAFNEVLQNQFLQSMTYQDWATDIAWQNFTVPKQIKAYRFSVGLTNFSTPNDQVKAMNTLRSMADRFPDLNITTYMIMWLFADQYQLVLPNTLENIAIALVLMVLVSIILIPNPLCSICVALMIVSIDVGVVGYMTFWGVSLDAVSMITIIMSVGFSVDFTAHVSYGYVVLSQEQDPVKRMQVTLGARAWPVTQAGLVTILGILALAGVPAYLIVTFFKTVFLVMTIGVVHAIVFLPVVLDMLIRPVLACGDARRNKKINKVANSSHVTNNGSAHWTTLVAENPALFFVTGKKLSLANKSLEKIETNPEERIYENESSPSPSDSASTSSASESSEVVSSDDTETNCISHKPTRKSSNDTTTTFVTTVSVKE